MGKAERVGGNCRAGESEDIQRHEKCRKSEVDSFDAHRNILMIQTKTPDVHRVFLYSGQAISRILSSCPCLRTFTPDDHLSSSTIADGVVRATSATICIAALALAPERVYHEPVKPLRVTGHAPLLPTEERSGLLTFHLSFETVFF